MSSGSLDGALPRLLITRAVEQALAEDLGTRGDITTDATVPASVQAVATFGARKAGVISGLAVAEVAFHALDPEAGFEPLVPDGIKVEAGTVVARVRAPARVLLTVIEGEVVFDGR